MVQTKNTVNELKTLDELEQMLSCICRVDDVLKLSGGSKDWDLLLFMVLINGYNLELHITGKGPRFSFDKDGTINTVYEKRYVPMVADALKQAGGTSDDLDVKLYSAIVLIDDLCRLIKQREGITKVSYKLFSD